MNHSSTTTSPKQWYHSFSFTAMVWPSNFGWPLGYYWNFPFFTTGANRREGSSVNTTSSVLREKYCSWQYVNCIFFLCQMHVLFCLKQHGVLCCIFIECKFSFFYRIVNNAFGIPGQHLIIILLNENLTVIELVNIIKKEKQKLHFQITFASASKSTLEKDHWS